MWGIHRGGTVAKIDVTFLTSSTRCRGLKSHRAGVFSRRTMGSCNSVVLYLFPYRFCGEGGASKYWRLNLRSLGRQARVLPLCHSPVPINSLTNSPNTCQVVLGRGIDTMSFSLHSETLSLINEIKICLCET